MSSNFRNQPPQKRETTHLPQNENQGKIPGNSKCSLVANAEMETEIKFLLYRSKRRGVSPQSSLGLTSRLKRTGNQSLYSFGGSHTPVPFAVTLPHPTEAEVTVPHPSPLALCHFSTPVGQGRHIWPCRPYTAQLRKCQSHQLQLRWHSCTVQYFYRDRPCRSLHIQADASKATSSQLSNNYFCVPGT